MKIDIFVLALLLIVAMAEEEQNGCEELVCEDNYFPVCATDGTSEHMTFNNSCLLAKYKCENRSKRIRVLFEGDCKTGPILKDCSEMVCNMNYYHPRCATDGYIDPMTFRNACLYRKYKCEHPGTSIMVIYKGECH